MKKYLQVSYFIVSITLTTSLSTFAQEIQITNVPVSQYSIDRYTNEIYYQNELTGDVYKTNSSGSYHLLTEFSSAPQFANDSHKAVYVDFIQPTTNLYLYDFEEDSTYFLGNYLIPVPLINYPILFSPSDDRLLFTGESNLNLIYYSFLDSSIHFTGKSIFTNAIEWLTDSTIISTSNYEIISINIDDLTVDTLVFVPDTVIISGLSYNENINSFAYSKEYYYTVGNSFINIFNVNTLNDTTVYNFRKDGPSLGGFGIFIRSLTWNKKNNKLGYIGEVIANPLSFIYAYDPATSKAYQYTDWSSADGIKYQLRWLDTDTVLYTNATNGSLLYSLDVSNPVGINEKVPKHVDDLRVQSYPNPFNSSARISVEIPFSGNLKFNLFSATGELISDSDNLFVTVGKVEYDIVTLFKLQNLSTGVYFVRIRLSSTEDFFRQRVVKLLYLK